MLEKDNLTEVQNKFSGNFGISPFIFTGLYYTLHGKYIFGLILDLLCVLLPLKSYFLVGLVVALFFGKVKSKATLLSVFLTVVLLILFIIGKLVRINIIGGV